MIRDRFGTYYRTPMSLAEAIRQGIPLVFEEREGTTGRIMAEAFVFNGNRLAYAEIGWETGMHPGHPIHVVKGRVSGTGPWRVGRSYIRKLDHGDPLVRSYNEWSRLRPEDPAERKRLREVCWQDFLSSGLVSANAKRVKDG